VDTNANVELSSNVNGINNVDNFENQNFSVSNFSISNFIPRFVFPQFDTFKWIQLVIAFILVGGFYFATLYVFLRVVVLDSKSNVKPFKWSCFNSTDMDRHVCFFSVGQFSKGLISIGQVNIGLVCIGQGNIGLLFAFGQAALGWGVSIGQIASGFLIPFGQVAFAFYRVMFAQLGVQFLRCFFPGNRDSRLPPNPFVSCHGTRPR